MSVCKAGRCPSGKAILEIANLLNEGPGEVTIVTPSLVVDRVRDSRAEVERLTRERDEARAALDEAGALHLDTLADRVRDIAGDIDIIAKQRDSLRADNARLRGALEEARDALNDTVADSWPVLMDTIDAALAREGEGLYRTPAEARRPGLQGALLAPEKAREA